MTPRDAEQLFAAHGVEAARLDEEDLRRAWVRVVRSVHPDNGGASAEAALLNAAYAVLRRQARPSSARSAGPPFGPRQGTDDPKRDGVAVWAWAGADALPLSDRIERPDLSDRNFVKRRMWELCGRRTDEWTIWPFDGQDFLSPLTVYATSDQFAEMVYAAQHFARVGTTAPLAVVAARSLGCVDVWLIGVRGEPLARPERYPVRGDPRTDIGLLRTLRLRLAP